MKITPILTEKSLNRAKEGIYSFWVLPVLTKNQIAKVISERYDVVVKKVKTLNYKKTIKRNWKGRVSVRPAIKKALVYLKGDKKIDIFEVESKKSKS